MVKTRARRRIRAVRKKTRVTVDFSIEEHRRLKAIASLRGETLQDFIRDSVEEKISETATKNKLEMLDELGILGALEESHITSTNYREFIMKSIKSKHD